MGVVHKVLACWCSTHTSLGRYNKLRLVIKYLCDGCSDLEGFLPEEEETDLVNNIVRFVAPLATIIKLIKGHKYPTFSQVMGNIGVFRILFGSSTLH